MRELHSYKDSFVNHCSTVFCVERQKTRLNAGCRGRKLLKRR